MSLLSGVMDRSSVVRRHGLLWVGLAAFVEGIVVVDPLRDMPLEDEWGYAWSVERLVETGRFEAHDWAAANPLLLVYWGWLFSTLFGFSFAVLRVSTLVLAMVGWVAFYFLAKHHGLDNDEAGVLALALFASPLVFQFSPSFMGDVPFLVSVIVALLLYSQAIRHQSAPLMALASLAAAGAVLTRQFGVALIGGLVLSWALDRNRRRWPLLCILGLALPVAAAVWQLAYGLGSPSWGVCGPGARRRWYWWHSAGRPCSPASLSWGTAGTGGPGRAAAVRCLLVSLTLFFLLFILSFLISWEDNLWFFLRFFLPSAAVT